MKDKFVQKKDGKGLFVKRKDKDGHVLASRGWYVWKGENRHEQE